MISVDHLCVFKQLAGGFGVSTKTLAQSTGATALVGVKRPNMAASFTSHQTWPCMQQKDTGVLTVCLMKTQSSRLPHSRTNRCAVLV